MNWKKRIINRWDNGEIQRYEWQVVGLPPNDNYTIDVSLERESMQGFAGSNQVNVFMPKYGGWILGTPKNFKTKKDVSAFVSFAKKQIEQGKFGKKVAFPE